MAKNKKDELPFGRVLKKIMEQRNLSFRAIAELAEVSHSVAQGWVEGRSPQDLQAVAKLAKGLGIGFKALLLDEADLITDDITLGELFEEEEVYDGLLKVSIKKMVPRK